MYEKLRIWSKHHNRDLLHLGTAAIEAFLMQVVYIIQFSKVLPNFLKAHSQKLTVQTVHNSILYRYFIALREIYQNVCPEVPGNPRDVIFPNAKGEGKYNISGIPLEPRDKRFDIFPEKQWNNCFVTFYSWKRLKKSIQNSIGNVTPADSRDVVNNVARTVECPSLFQSDVLSIPKISAVNITFSVPAMRGQYNVTQYLAR